MSVSFKIIERIVTIFQIYALDPIVEDKVTNDFFYKLQAKIKRLPQVSLEQSFYISTGFKTNNRQGLGLLQFIETTVSIANMLSYQAIKEKKAT